MIEQVKLSRVEFAKVYVWLESKREYLEKTRETYEALAEACRKHTGIENVTPTNIKSAMRDCGIERKPFEKIGTGKHYAEQVRELQAELNVIRATVAAILADMKAEVVETADGTFLLKTKK